MQIDQVIAEIQPTLQGLETDRRAVKSAQQKFYLIMIPVVILLVFIAVAFFPFGLFGVVLGLIVSGFIHHQIVGRPKKKFVDAYKDTVISKLVKLVDPSLQYHANRGLPQNDFDNSELFSKRPDRYHTEDLVHGELGETSFQLAEVVAKERRTSRDSKGRTKTRYVTFFRGLLLIADFHKHFHGRTFVFPDMAEGLFGSFGRTLQSFGGRSGTKLTQMENVEFEREFAIYTSDEVEARYILTPSMMERILAMRKDRSKNVCPTTRRKWQRFTLNHLIKMDTYSSNGPKRFGQDVRMAFKESSVWIAVPHTHEYLEPTHHVAATDTTQIRRMLDEVSPFINTIEELDLNTRIWTKK